MFNIVHRDDEYSMNLARKISSALELHDISDNIVIAVGGDGTILRAVHQFKDRLKDVVIFGVRSGHLGFFTDFTEESLNKMLDAIRNKTYKVHRFSLGKGKIFTKTETRRFVCLNEFQILEPHKLVVFDVFLDGKHFETFRGNGLCFSTPAGSTGMNKSLHGAVIDPLISGMQMTEIAPINSNAYRTIGSPIVFSKHRHLQLKTVEPTKIELSYDHLTETIDDCLEVEFRLSNQQVQIAYVDDNPFFERVRKAFL